jgi:hypothetical protein
VIPPEDAGGAPQAGADDGLPDAIDDSAPDSERSLIEDVEALIDDGKTYLEAELVYQKTRAAYVADKAKGALVYGAVAAALAFLALFGLIVGLIISLAPLLTPWGASALVVALLILGAVVCGRTAARRWGRLMSAIDTVRGDEP